MNLSTSEAREAQLSQRDRATHYISVKILSNAAQLHDKLHFKRFEV